MTKKKCPKCGYIPGKNEGVFDRKVKSVQIHLRVSPDEKESIAKNAKAAGSSGISDYLLRRGLRS